MTDHADLIRRLRDQSQPAIPYRANGYMHEAADALEALTAERDVLDDKLRLTESRLAEARREAETERQVAYAYAAATGVTLNHPNFPWEVKS